VKGLLLKKATTNIFEAAEQAVYRGKRGATCHLDTSRGLITPGWVARVRVYED